MIANLTEARAVVAVARRHRQQLLLLTEPGACARVGPGYLLEMTRQAGCEGETVRALLDCGEDAGYAMLALRLGWTELHLTGDPNTIDSIAQMTHAVGGRFHADLPKSLTSAGGVAVDQSLDAMLARAASN